MYYRVSVASTKYKSHEALTYESAEKLTAGSLVRVPLKNDLILGVVVGASPKPKFATKPLQSTGLAVPPQLIQTAEWISHYYVAPPAAVLQSILPSQLSDRRLQEAAVTTTPPQPEGALPPLTQQQTKALATINKADTYLLHGETGTGKTRIYLELAMRALAEGRSAIILTPEIGLTSQLSRNLQAHLPGHVTILHSQLTAREREQAWLKLARATGPQVVVGPRSALFSPLPSIGLIVIDEAHDSSYKQDQTPRYHALRAAAKLSQLHKATLILGSATPNVEDYYVAEQRNKAIIRITELAKGATLPAEVHIIDLKDRSQFKGGGMLSLLLVSAIKEALARGEQSLLYLNRRGTARLVLCEHCGWQAACPRCDIPLIYHGDDHTLRCHTCGYSQGIFVSCPDCSHPSIIFKLVGTKAIADEARRHFPEARIGRFDTDNKKEERLEANYDAVRNGEIDILIGTQTLSKGLDLPLLTTLGVVLADTSLSLPDFSAGERTYQQLTQVLGRIGRGHITNTAPRAYVQTYQPDNTIIKAAVARNWNGFYKTELSGRQKFLYPPFVYLLKINCRRATSAAAEKAITKFADGLKSFDVIVDGPAPAFHEKVAGKYDWHLVLKAKKRSELLRVLETLPTSVGWTYDLDPGDLL